MFALYRKGTTHNVGGVDCEIIRVPEGDLEGLRKQGWVDDIADLTKKAKVKNENKNPDNQ